MFTSLFILTPQSDEGTSAISHFTAKFSSLVTGAQIVNTYARGREREEDGKPCVTSDTIILFEITFCQTSLFLNRSFCTKTENSNVN